MGTPILHVALLLLGWAAVVAATGGSSAARNGIGSILVAQCHTGRAGGRLARARGVAAGLSGTRQARSADPVGALGGTRAPRRVERSHFDRVATALAWVLAVALFALGVGYSTRAAGGADGFGYVSQAALLAQGRLGVDRSYAGSLPWLPRPGTFVPIAYRLGAKDVMGPTVAPGLPLLMALARTLSACGPYLVVPLCGGILVLATFWLGKRLSGAGPSLAAAALVAFSPVVVFESLVVMADVPAAAFCVWALAVALRRTGGQRTCCRPAYWPGAPDPPNLLPLAAFPWLLAICRLQDAKVAAAARTALFAMGSIPAALDHCVHQLPHPRIGVYFGLWRPGKRVRARPRRNQRQALLGVMARESGTRRPAGSRRLVAMAGRNTPRGRDSDRVCGRGVAALSVLPAVRSVVVLRFLIPAIPVVLLLCTESCCVGHAAPGPRRDAQQ